MPFVSRDNQDNITGIFREATASATEELPPTHPAIVRFLFDDQPTPTDNRVNLSDISLSDLGMVRVIEDLIDVLIEKNVLSIADLPEPAIARLSSRKSIRAQMDEFNRVLADTTE